MNLTPTMSFRKNHLLRRMNVFVTAVLAGLHSKVSSFYSDVGPPSVDPEFSGQNNGLVFCATWGV